MEACACDGTPHITKTVTSNAKVNGILVRIKPYIFIKHLKH